ncbi:forkhead-associated domain-containing protein 1-like [Bicyclus anynana]|uniref:Forkhead-associated domain-containing protein 1-like n=1 Tax=Bicyclus anynana TaxID=110368 RepID=A0ABM3LGC1_BICAN|nr:forkhead-associated domain-containing protein 1-like [Bicyclus anynana]
MVVPVQFPAAGLEQLPLLPESPEQPLRSRPQTPGSVSSCPPTPKSLSRPSTPAHPSQRHGTPASRPNTPQRNTPPTKPRTPSVPASSLSRPETPSKKSSAPPSPLNGNDLKSEYIIKRKQYQELKKELDLKQKTVLELYNGLRVLREHMTREGIPYACQGHQELVMYNVADWAPEEVAQMCRDAASPDTSTALELFKTTLPVDDSVLSDIQSKTLNIPGYFAELCLQAFTERQELIDWVKEFIQNHEFVGTDAVERVARYNTQGLELCEALREMKSRADNVVDTAAEFSKKMCLERSTLIAVGETLVREIAELRQDLENRPRVRLEKRETRAEDDVTANEELRRELEEERTAKTALKEKLATTESLLKQTRLRVSKMDKQLRESEASIASLTGTVKALEDQNRQRDVQLEARARKLKETLKTEQMATGHLAQKRDALQAEVNALKEQIQSMTTQHKSEVQDLNNKLKELIGALEEQKNMTQRITEEKHEVEMSLMETQNTIEDLKTQIINLEDSIPNPELPTEREMDLWAELSATKDILRNTEEEVSAVRKEKVRFLETMTKIAETENKSGMQQKLMSEILNKEETISKMKIQIRELTKNMKHNEQKVIQYENYVKDLHSYARTRTNCQEAPNDINYQELKDQILNFQTRLLDAEYHNEKLSQDLLQKEQQLSTQDSTSKAQARVIKVREELINVLKNKESEQSRELFSLQKDLEQRMKVVDEVNKQIAAKADEIQELFATLENKQQQIHRLEKIVLVLEEQQRRAQAQRTRHEEKIAALEHELAAGGNRRERKSSFFSW